MGAAMAMQSPAADVSLQSDARRVEAALVESRAVGAARAMRQTDVAARCGLSTRRVQQCMGWLIQHDVAVCSSCVEPMGIFLAETIEELDAYIAQLHSRLVGNAERERDLRALRRRRIAATNVEPDGQRRLFA